MASQPDVLMVGGPNGAGKTSWATRSLSALGIREFVNADEIARGLSPLDPDAGAIAAGRVMIERLNVLVRSGESFAFETTCAGLRHVRLLKTCRSAGYRTTLIFLWLPSSDAAVARVARRVHEGGHRIPIEVIKRRYDSGLRTMRHKYLALADMAHIYDNSDGAGILIASRQMDGQLVIHDEVRWSQIEEATR
jgi:predicted ABC-type ATPase